jgi:3-dehydrotetronate 4-kinase
VRAAQEQLGRDRAGRLVEDLIAAVAAALPAQGFSRILVAGGETSGAVVNALGVKALSIGPEIDPGVPWTRSLSGPDVALALKSGNFGTPDFFLKAWSYLQ